MKKEYVTLIAEHDKTLAYLRSEWMDSKVAEKPKWLDMINAALDERLRLMQLRDAPPKKRLTKSKDVDTLGGS